MYDTFGIDELFKWKLNINYDFLILLCDYDFDLTIDDNFLYIKYDDVLSDEIKGVYDYLNFNNISHVRIVDGLCNMIRVRL